ncbi:hypothetical protein BCR32DRAFT_296430 [Anaeromyces robustus]|uniref:Mid2 domain-containing protein n=1 Tax=Anaeromyces robustus TaxID=1754192 RepID=A0A1Y1WSF1_9FUNG|nr:hypothetical protein BCR32DRAFT_296430 [Anaeromyces robustus]|eukprot:ORX76176.1 hypothetical protein BCR32DRAFT_296430 [Anaeromyces robustus]
MKFLAQNFTFFLIVLFNSIICQNVNSPEVENLSNIKNNNNFISYSTDNSKNMKKNDLKEEENYINDFFSPIEVKYATDKDTHETVTIYPVKRFIIYKQKKNEINKNIIFISAFIGTIIALIGSVIIFSYKPKNEKNKCINKNS